MILIHEHEDIPEMSEALKLTSADGATTVKEKIPSLDSSQEETDTRVVLYALFALQKGYKTVKAHSPESDIFSILLFYVHMLNGITVLFDT